MEIPSLEAIERTQLRARARVVIIGVAAFLLLGAGIAYGLNKQDSGSDAPVANGIPVKVDESPTSEQAEAISRFPMLEEPTAEKMAELSQTDLDWIRFGLDQSRGCGSTETSTRALSLPEPTWWSTENPSPVKR